MDPIKVDFSSKDGGQGKGGKVIIPPEKKGIKILINIIITLIAAGIGYYFYLPAMNFKSVNMYIFFAAVLLVYCAVNYLTSGALKTPDYAPYAKKSARIPTALIALIVVVVVIGFIISSVVFRAKSYSKIIDVESGDFVQEVSDSSDDSFSTVPRIDSDTTSVLAQRALSDLSELGYVSQFTVQPSYTQINYRDVPVRLATLQYSNIIKWFTNRDTRIPAYIRIDTITQKAELVKVDGGIQYSTADHFAHNLIRHLRFKYPTYLFAEPTFETDDNGNPYWITAKLDKTIGLFGGTDVVGAVICNAATGECTEYSLEQLRNDSSLEWIDRVYSAELLVEQYDYYGTYQGGFWNSILGQKDTYSTTEGYSYLAINDDVYLYTGVTSLTNDESLTGFTLINMRTKEAKYYTISGAKESSAQTSAEGLVQQYKYTASFPLLLNVDGEPTYFMSLKDSSNLVKMYALVNVGQYSICAEGSSLTECIENYLSELAKNGIKLNVSTDNIAEENDSGSDAEKPKTIEVTGKITDIRTAVLGGESVYYFKLDTSDSYYSVKASAAQKVVIFNTGDTVTFTVDTESGTIIPVNEVK